MNEELNEDGTKETIEKNVTEYDTGKQFVENFAATGEIMKEKSDVGVVNVIHSEDNAGCQSEVKIFNGGIQLLYSFEKQTINVYVTEDGFESQLIKSLKPKGSHIMDAETNLEVTPYDILNEFQFTASFKNLINK